MSGSATQDHAEGAHLNEGRPRTQLSFLKLVVRNLPVEAAFYRTLLGYEQVQAMEGQIMGRPVEEVLLAGSASFPALLIVQYTDGGRPLPEPTGVITGIVTADLPGFQRRVLDAGGKVAQPISSIETPEGSMQLAFYADPEGFLLQVIEAA